MAVTPVDEVFKEFKCNQMFLLVVLYLYKKMLSVDSPFLDSNHKIQFLGIIARFLWKMFLIKFYLIVLIFYNKKFYNISS